MECLRRLLRRSSEALFLLQMLSQHHITRLVQVLDLNTRKKLVELTFHQLVCSDEGDQLAMRLISELMEVFFMEHACIMVFDISIFFNYKVFAFLK